VIVEPLRITAVPIRSEAIEHARVSFRQSVVETQIRNLIITVDVSGIDEAQKPWEPAAVIEVRRLSV